MKQTKYNKLFYPFRYIGDTKALVIGLVCMLLASLGSMMVGYRYDGFLDYHQYGTYSWWYFADIFIAWLLISIFTILIATINKKSCRWIDVFGMYAFAFIPICLSPLIVWITGLDNLNMPALEEMSIVELQNELMPYTGQLVLNGLILVMFLVLFVAYCYQVFKVNLNLQKTQSIAWFVGLVLITEVVSIFIIRAY